MTVKLQDLRCGTLLIINNTERFAIGSMSTDMALREPRDKDGRSRRADPRPSNHVRRLPVADAVIYREDGIFPFSRLMYKITV